MAEGFREWGDYGEEQQWQEKSKVKKIFSFRTLKKIIKVIGIVLVGGIYALLAYRLITGLGVPQRAKKLLWNDKAISAYESEGDNLIIYKQDPEATFGNDGYFSIYQVKYIPKISQIQFTIRYNQSTVKALKAELGDGGDVDTDPFAYILRDNTGKVYTNYYISSYTSGLYTYVRLAFDDVALFNTKTVPAEHQYGSPDEKYSDLIYKGPNKSEAISSDISYLYIDFYYENDVKYEAESWADPLLVYRGGLEISEYDYSKDLPKNSGKDEIIYRSISES